MTDLTPMPASDTRVGEWISYGPRVERVTVSGIGTEEVHFESPNPGEAPHVWSVYVRHPQGGWSWMADAGTEDFARLIAHVAAGVHGK